MTEHNEPTYYRTELVHHLPRGIFARASVLSFLGAASVIFLWLG